MGQGGRDPSAGLKQMRRPQDDDAHRMVREAEDAEKTVNRRLARDAGIEWGRAGW
jgi:hypothetical protein